MSEEHSNEWRDKHFLSELQRNTAAIKELDTTLGNVRVEIARLKITAGLWGAAAGAVPTLAAIAYMILNT